MHSDAHRFMFWTKQYASQHAQMLQDHQPLFIATSLHRFEFCGDNCIKLRVITYTFTTGLRTYFP